MTAMNNKGGVLEYSVEAMTQGTKRWIDRGRYHKNYDGGGGTRTAL
jgi:hypothetical protein